MRCLLVADCRVLWFLLDYFLACCHISLGLVSLCECHYNGNHLPRIYSVPGAQRLLSLLNANYVASSFHSFCLFIFYGETEAWKLGDLL